MTKQSEISEGSGDPLNTIGLYRPEVLVPGYWDSLSSNCTRWAEEVSVGPYWAEAKNRLTTWRQEYKSSTTADLLASTLPQFVSKSPTSIKSKLLRRCAKDKEFIDVAFPQTGPPVPAISDLVRTRIACRYIDGVEFLASKLCALAEEQGFIHTRERQGRIEGYFAQHVTITQDVIHRFGGVATQTKILAEIQVATDFGTRMWDATHPIYENVREVSASSSMWQWQPEDPRFIANQLGHMVHLADGLLMQLRNSAPRKK